MFEVWISQDYKLVDHHNKLSGHSWTETVFVNKWSVHGGGFTETKHNSLKSAEKEKAMRERMLKKFPFLIPTQIKKRA